MIGWKSWTKLALSQYNERKFVNWNVKADAKSNVRVHCTHCRIFANNKNEANLLSPFQSSNQKVISFYQDFECLGKLFHWNGYNFKKVVSNFIFCLLPKPCTQTEVANRHTHKLIIHKFVHTSLFFLHQKKTNTRFERKQGPTIHSISQAFINVKLIRLWLSGTDTHARQHSPRISLQRNDLENKKRWFCHDFGQDGSGDDAVETKNP